MIHALPAPLRRLVLLALLLPGLAGGTAALAAPPGKTAPRVEIVAAEFGLFHDGAPGELVFEPAAVIPHRNGQRYGWVIEVRSAQRSLSVQEEYLLPPASADAAMSPPAAPGELLERESERRRQVSQRQLVPHDGRIFGEWAIGPREPAGPRRLRVLVEGVPAATFDYEVR